MRIYVGMASMPSAKNVTGISNFFPVSTNVETEKYLEKGNSGVRERHASPLRINSKNISTGIESI